MQQDGSFVRREAFPEHRRRVAEQVHFRGGGNHPARDLADRQRKDFQPTLGLLPLVGSGSMDVFTNSRASLTMRAPSCARRITSANLVHERRLLSACRRMFPRPLCRTTRADIQREPLPVLGTFRALSRATSGLCMLSPA